MQKYILKKKKKNPTCSDVHRFKIVLVLNSPKSRYCGEIRLGVGQKGSISLEGGEQENKGTWERAVPSERNLGSTRDLYQPR